VRRGEKTSKDDGRSFDDDDDDERDDGFEG
jgi:hypothetical protein